MSQDNRVAPLSTSSSATDVGSLHHRQVSSVRSNDLATSSSAPSDVILPTKQVSLKRHIGLFSGICYIISTIIGSGIFVSPKGVLRETQSVALCLIVWVACGFISLMGAVCYAEISSIIQRNGSEIAYIKEGIGSVHERTGDILAYLFTWTTAFVLKPSGIAILTLTFSQYFLSGVMDGCGPPDELVKMVAILAIFVLININSASASVASRLNIVFVILKVVTIVTVIIGGLVRLGQGYTENLKTGFAGTTSKPLGVAIAFYSGLWAYDGWGSLTVISEEIKNPKRNIWLSMMLALPTVMVLYVLTNISYFTVMSKAALLSSNAVAVTWGESVLGPVVRALPILISISALGTANASLYGGGRYCMVGSQYGYLPEVFACIHIQRLTPLPSIVFQGLLAVVFCIPSNIGALIDFISFTSWMFYGLTFAATLCCKFTKRDADRTLNVPIPIIVLIILISIFLVVIPVVVSPNIGFLVAACLVLLGLVFYYPFVYRKIELSFMNKINSSLKTFFYLQKAQVVI